MDGVGGAPRPLVEYGASTLLRAQDMELPSQVAEERCHVVAMGAGRDRGLVWLRLLCRRYTQIHKLLFADTWKKDDDTHQHTKFQLLKFFASRRDQLTN